MAKVYQSLGNTNAKCKNYQDALDSYLVALDFTPNDTLLIFQIARHYDSFMNNPDKALEYYSIFIDTRPINNDPNPSKKEAIVISYYDYAEKRMTIIKEELFMLGEKNND